MTDSGEALSFIAAALSDLRRRYRRDGFHRPTELAAVLRLAASGGQERPILDADAEIGDALAVSYSTAAQRLSISVRTVRRLVASGELPRVEIGSCQRITVRDLEAYVEGLMRERSA